MNVSLTPQLEAMVRRKVDSGLYTSASEVVREALRLMDEEDRRDRLRAAIAVANEQVARGEVVEWTPDFMDRLMQEAAEEERLGVPMSEDAIP